MNEANKISQKVKRLVTKCWDRSIYLNEEYGVTKKVGKALRQKLVEWMMKHSNVRESPISRDTLIIIDEESGVKQRVPKILLECSMR